jgi:hypothetical protein
MVTKETARQINAHVKQKLGVSWDLLDSADLNNVVLKPGISVEEHPPFPARLLQDGWKVGTTSWCCVCCNVLKRVPIAIPGLKESVNLVLFEVPEDTMAILTRRLAGGLPRYFAQPVGCDSFFPCYNWNPIPLRSVEEFEKYLTGWSM